MTTKKVSHRLKRNFLIFISAPGTCVKLFLISPEVRPALWEKRSVNGSAFHADDKECLSCVDLYKKREASLLEDRRAQERAKRQEKMNRAIAFGMDVVVNQTSGSQTFVLTEQLVHVRISIWSGTLLTFSESDE